MRFARIEEGWVRVDDSGLVLLDAAPWLSPNDVRTLPESRTPLCPVMPTKVVCVGRNYAAHAAELGNEVPKEPLLFLKPPSALVASEAAIELPPQSQRVEHEGELGVVIGAQLRNGNAVSAKDAIFGYLPANDVTARDVQRADVQFTRGKGFDTFCPVGPFIETQFDPSDVSIQVRVNEELRQDGRTSAMIHGVYDLVAYISGVMTLEPGDLVLTGTPAGVGPLVTNDVVEVAIEGLEPLRSKVKTRPTP